MTRMDAAEKMIAALPEEGCTIVVARNDIGSWLREGIVERRGASMAKRCRMITIQHQSDVIKLAGLRERIIIHDSFTNSNVQSDVKARVAHLIAKTEAMNA